MDKNRLSLLILGSGVILIVLWLAQQSSGDSLTGVPCVESEEQFGGLSADIGSRDNTGTMLDMSPDIHFFVPGYNCPGQSQVLTRHRYPVVAGGNISTLIHRGFDAFKLGSPDNDWRTQPPSEYTL
jgi:hypothetical protein